MTRYTVTNSEFDDGAYILNKDGKRIADILFYDDAKEILAALKSAQSIAQAAPEAPSREAAPSKGELLTQEQRDAIMSAVRKAWPAGFKDTPYKAMDKLVWNVEQACVAALAQQGASHASNAGKDTGRDAARYRWLREKRDIPAGARNIPWAVALDPNERIHTMVLRAGIDLDHAIDAAIAASTEQEKKNAD
jgi:hypothetical protein